MPQSKAGSSTVVLGLFLILLAIAGCREDWASRMGILPAAKVILDPFPSYPLQSLNCLLADDPPSFSFAIVGGTRLGEIGKEYRESSNSYREIVETLFSLEPLPRFLVHLGDISAAPMAAKEGWAHLVSLSGSYHVPNSIEDLARSDRLFLLALPGEKDVGDRKSEKAFLETLGFLRKHVYFSFQFKSIQFLVLNSEEVDDGIVMRWLGWNREQNRIRGSQLRWLETELARSGDSPKIVFLHKPFFPPIFSSHEGYCLDQYYWDRERLLRLFRKYRVAAVFSDHETVFSHSEVSGTAYFIVGGTGPTRPKRLGGFRQFLLVAVYQTERLRVFAINLEDKTMKQEVWVNLTGGVQGLGEK